MRGRNRGRPVNDQVRLLPRPVLTRPEAVLERDRSGGELPDSGANSKGKVISGAAPARARTSKVGGYRGRRRRCGDLCTAPPTPVPRGIDPKDDPLASQRTTSGRRAPSRRRSGAGAEENPRLPRSGGSYSHPLPAAAREDLQGQQGKRLREYGADHTTVERGLGRFRRWEARGRRHCHCDDVMVTLVPREDSYREKIHTWESVISSLMRSRLQ